LFIPPERLQFAFSEASPSGLTRRQASAPSTKSGQGQIFWAPKGLPKSGGYRGRSVSFKLIIRTYKIRKINLDLTYPMPSLFRQALTRCPHNVR
jgi:hypothetical protein